jgi:hypothetical protein
MLGDSAYDPTSYQLEGSNDGITFNPIASGVVPAFFARQMEHDFFFGNSVAYRIYRILFSSSAPTSLPFGVQVAEVQLFGTVGSAFTLALTASPAAGGTINASPSSTDNKYGSNIVVTLTAKPNAGYVFTSWGGAISGSANPTVITMNGNKSVTANFAPIGTLQIAQLSWSVNENGSAATITVTRADGSAGAVGVSYATSNGTATAGSDYTATSGALSWADGEAAAKTFSVPILNDRLRK